MSEWQLVRMNPLIVQTALVVSPGRSIERPSSICRWWRMIWRTVIIGLGCSNVSMQRCRYNSLSSIMRCVLRYNLLVGCMRMMMMMMMSYRRFVWCSSRRVSSRVASLSVASSLCVLSSCRLVITVTPPSPVYSCCWCQGFVFLHWCFDFMMYVFRYEAFDPSSRRRPSSGGMGRSRSLGLRLSLFHFYFWSKCAALSS